VRPPQHIIEDFQSEKDCLAADQAALVGEILVDALRAWRRGLPKREDCLAAAEALFFPETDDTEKRFKIVFHLRLFLD
jgi:hypothetical protein